MIPPVSILCVLHRPHLLEYGRCSSPYLPTYLPIPPSYFGEIGGKFFAVITNRLTLEIAKFFMHRRIRWTTKRQRTRARLRLEMPERRSKKRERKEKDEDGVEEDRRKRALECTKRERPIEQSEIEEEKEMHQRGRRRRRRGL